MGTGVRVGERVSLGARAVLHPNYDMIRQKYTCDEVSISTAPTQKKIAHVKTGEIQVRSIDQLIVLNQGQFFSFDHCAGVLSMLSLGKTKRQVQEDSTIFAT